MILGYGRSMDLNWLIIKKRFSVILTEKPLKPWMYFKIHQNHDKNKTFKKTLKITWKPTESQKSWKHWRTLKTLKHLENARKP